MNTSPVAHTPANPGQNGVELKDHNGLVAAAVLWTARQSAGLTSRLLAETAYVNEADILTWEKGTEPLASVPVAHVDRLKKALRTAGACPELVADLDAACWCDVVIEAIIRHDDVSCLLADPLANDSAFKDLFAWAVAGVVPSRYASTASSAGRP